MILIADSGSTKTDWRLIDHSGAIQQAKTQGLNPFFKTSQDCLSTFKNDLIPQFGQLNLDLVKEIWFYGSGCSSEKNCSVLKVAFEAIFLNADINIEHDLLGAARALCGDKPGIAAILGTGSNSCYFDGHEIVRNVTALGYILGDEGSGSNIGKKLIKDFLDQELPTTIRDRFDEHFGYSKEQLLDEVYTGDLPNRFLASFAKWVIELKNHEEYAFDLVKSCIDSFLNKHILKYNQHKEVPLHVVGSIGYFNKPLLEKLCKEKSIVLGTVIRTPISGLVLFHAKR